MCSREHKAGTAGARTTAEPPHRAEDTAGTATHARTTHHSRATTGTQAGHNAQTKTKEYTRVHRGVIR